MHVVFIRVRVNQLILCSLTCERFTRRIFLKQLLNAVLKIMIKQATKSLYNVLACRARSLIDARKSSKRPSQNRDSKTNRTAMYLWSLQMRNHYLPNAEFHVPSLRVSLSLFI